MKYTGIFVGVVMLGIGVWAMFTQAQTQITGTETPDEWVCVKAVSWGFRYMSETDAETVQSGIWQIIKDPTLDDNQTYVTLMVFHTIQQISYNVTDNPEATGGMPEKFWLSTLNRINAECEYLLNEQRFPTK